MNFVPDTAHYFSDGVYAKQMYLPKGHKAVSHVHKYDHLSILATGAVVVACDGVETTYKAPSCIEIKAGVEHEITALADVVWYCIHGIEKEQVGMENIDEVLIEESK